MAIVTLCCGICLAGEKYVTRSLIIQPRKEHLLCKHLLLRLRLLPLLLFALPSLLTNTAIQIPLCCCISARQPTCGDIALRRQRLRQVQGYTPSRGSGCIHGDPPQEVHGADATQGRQHDTAPLDRHSVLQPDEHHAHLWILQGSSWCHAMTWMQRCHESLRRHCCLNSAAVHSYQTCAHRQICVHYIP